MESSKTLIRAVVALFAAVVGFGLKNTAENSSAELVGYHWAFFWILLLLAFRIICGASVHLADLYADGVKEKEVNRIVFDLFSLLAFAVLLLFATHAESVFDFLRLLLLPLAGAVIWAAVERRYWGHPLARSFFWINIASFLLVAFLLLLESIELSTGTIAKGWHESLVFFIALASLWVALVDIRKQMRHLESKTAKNNLAKEIRIYIQKRNPSANIVELPSAVGASKKIHSFHFLQGNDLIDIIPALAATTGESLRKSCDIKAVAKPGEPTPLFFVDDRIDKIAAAAEVRILQTIARAAPLSSLIE